MQPYVLGIDIGTGSTKAVAVDLQGKVLYATQAYYPAGTGPAAQDPEMIWQSLLQVMRNTLAVMPPPQAVSLSSAMHSVVVLDRYYKPLSPLLTWADDRASGIADALLAQPLGEVLYRTGGTPIHASAPLCKIRWWHENDPELFKKAAFFADIKAYIWWRLFGVLATDYSIASASGLLHLKHLCWNDAALAFAGITHRQLPALVDTCFCTNKLTPEAVQQTGLPAHTVFVMGASDGCLANLGSAALGNGVAAITIGTSGALRRAGSAPRFLFPAQLFNYYLDKDYWITGGAINNGGAAVAWIAKTLGYDAITDSLMEGMGDVVPGAGGLLFLPFLLGERAPIWDSHSSAAFVGLQQSHTPAHLVRAVVEGICFALRSVLHLLEEASGTVDTLHLSGGFTRSPAALQVLADCLGKKVVVLQTADASAIGAALLGLKAIGEVSSLSALPMPEIVHTYLPCAKAAEQYRLLYALYQPLYQQLQNTLHQLQQFREAC